MKRIVCFALTLITLCVSLTSCGAGGDTNMHKLMTAIDKEQVISCGYNDNPDVFSDVSLSELPFDSKTGWMNVNYDSTEAWANNVYYRHHIIFDAERVEIRENQYAKDFRIKIKWRAKENTIAIELYESYSYGVWDDAALDASYHGFNSEKGFTVSSYGAENDELVFDMNVYYEKGKFELSDATYDATAFTFSGKTNVENCEEIFFNDLLDLLNDALDGLNGIYSAKGFPIR